MPVVQRESSAEDLLLRPLCAKNLPATQPEREGWIDRDRLHDFSGRSRKPQMALAERLGLTDYAQPAGGCCFLTNAHYAAKLRDLWIHRDRRDYDLDDIVLLKVGRHIRPRAHFKLIVAREEGEGNYLQGYRNEYADFEVLSHGGPLTLVDGEIEGSDIELAARIVARYSQGRDAADVELRYTDRAGRSCILQVKPLPPHDLPATWIL